jgi:uncharacterized protein (TIGR00252 family)
VTNYSNGYIAEQKATEYLDTIGWKIIDRNWKTAWCEIDIIAKHNKSLYFIEVKYRKSDQQGSGIEYITKSKLQQMTRAAESWVLLHNYSSDYGLGAIELAGEDFRITEFITDLS